MHRIVQVIWISILVTSCNLLDKKPTESLVDLTNGVDQNEKLEIAAQLSPTKRQLRWLSKEKSMLVAIGLESYGSSIQDSLSLELFNPVEINPKALVQKPSRPWI